MLPDADCWVGVVCLWVLLWTVLTILLLLPEVVYSWYAGVDVVLVASPSSYLFFCYMQLDLPCFLKLAVGIAYCCLQYWYARVDGVLMASPSSSLLRLSVVDV
jgi:hypothetical protein